MSGLFNLSETKTIGQALAFYVFWCFLGIVAAMILGMTAASFVALPEVGAYWMGVVTATVCSLVLTTIALSAKNLSKGGYWYLYIVSIVLAFAFGVTAGFVPAVLISMAEKKEAV